jgi:eukaryotic-like serine/threonine-protein kinase
MGEVYKARDTRLDRTVAIKILPDLLADDPHFRERFDREARTISQLDDPHICALYDVGRENGTSYLVMQYLEGETLAVRLLKGPLAISEALKIGIEIAKALERAHRAGVIHRDLKPGNVMLTRSGAKLLDFGLAKTTAVSTTGASVLPTTPVSITAQGTILGTFQYMAPEQIEGQEADSRTDLFALGAVLFEMVTGRGAFHGKTQASLIGSILRDDPLMAADVAASVPLPLSRVIRTCLAKNPDDRFQTAHDVALQLQWLLEGGSQAGVQAPVDAGARKRRRWMPWAFAAVMAVAATAFAFAWLNRPLSEARVVKFDLPLPDTLVSIGAPRLSPDGRFLAFNATDLEGKTLVWIRPLDTLTAHPLAGTDGAARPFWSPDSRYLAFMADGKLKKIDVNGGPAQKICDAPSGADGSWSGQGTILFDGRSGDPIQRVSAAGGTATVAVQADRSRKEADVGWPEFLPDGRHFLYLALGQSPEDTAYRIGTLDSNDTMPLIAAQTQVSFALPGQLLFVRDNTLVAQPFDPKALKVTGDPVPLVEHVGVDSIGLALFSVSRNGTMAYRTGDSGTRLVFVNREGKEIETLGEKGEFNAPSVSKDGRFISYNLPDQRSGKVDIWIRDLARGISSRFTFGPGDNVASVWSPDGAQVAFTSGRSGPGDLYVKPTAGQGEETLLLKDDARKIPTDWSRDGRYVAYTASKDSKTKTDVFVLPTFGDRQPIAVATSPANESNLVFSPNGRFVAYRSDESGTNQIYVQTFPNPSRKWQVSNAGGNDPAWRSDGKELLYRGPDQHIMSVEISAGEQFDMSVPRSLFLARLSVSSIARNRYVVTPDAQRFLLVAPPGQEAQIPTTVVLNWAEQLKSR